MLFLKVYQLLLQFLVQVSQLLLYRVHHFISGYDRVTAKPFLQRLKKDLQPPLAPVQFLLDFFYSGEYGFFYLAF